MEATEEVVVVAPPCDNNDLSLVAKGKRTKRQRPHSPIPFTVNNNHRRSPSFSADDDSTTTEEEDTARCLILLAQGGHFHQHYDSDQNDTTKKNLETATAAVGSGGYACKTCNRVFSSFQALGGHRTSHKKPKNDKKPSMFYDIDEDYPRKKMATNSLSLQLNNTSTSSAAAAAKQLSSPRIHECSYCGSEFNSGQALGGHMRRHRAGPISPAAESKKPRNELGLDLNFPAPEDENQRLGFVSRQQKSPEKLVTSASTTPTLVDCHY